MFKNDIVLPVRKSLAKAAAKAYIIIANNTGESKPVANLTADKTKNDGYA